jgi:hypothetical protein
VLDWVTQTASNAFTYNMIGCIMVEGLLQNGEELQAAVQAFMVRLLTLQYCSPFF